MKDNTKFKELEKEFRSVLPSSSIMGIRLDGKSFHNFTKQYKRPYDTRFMKAMDKTAIELMNNLITGSMFGYVQSDEITVFFTDKWSAKNQFVFDGKIEKIISTSASTATGGFLRAEPKCNGIPVFDARLFKFSNLDEVQEYMDWRRLDARKNAVTMATGTLFSHKELMSVPTVKRAELLVGTELEVLPEGFFNGRLIKRETITKTVEYSNKKTGEVQRIEVPRKKLIAIPALRNETEQLVNSFQEKLFDK